MYAVVETGGKQYQVQEGRYVDIDLLDATPEAKIDLDKVVAVIAGEQSQIGQPYIDGACVHGKVLGTRKAKKVISYKMRKKKGYRVKQGHRQQYTRLMVESIDFPNKDKTVAYSKSLAEQEEKEIKDQEAKLQAAKEKRLARQKAQKEAKKSAKTVKAEAKPQKKSADKEAEGDTEE
ncbi:MAG: 50S ribosomal protein L21 [Vampirovibrionia bacterium]